jgi:hypothetical protein
MLSRAEILYIQGQKQVSQSYERKLKCLIRKKVEVLQKELPLPSKLFADNFKNFSCEFMNTNEEAPLPTKQGKMESPDLYPQGFKVKRATKFSNVESNEIETDATRIVRSQNFVESALFIKDEKTHAMSRLISNV